MSDRLVEFAIKEIRHADGVKCPRCWKWTGEGRFNFDHLCDSCCRVILDCHPTHESVPFIRAAYAAQRAQWRVA